MKGILTENQIHYVFYHLNLIVDFSEYIHSFEIDYQKNELKGYHNKVVFKLSDDGLSLDNIRWLKQIPIVFPIAKNNTPYTIKNGILVFHHDFLKSCFYFLSGYQEYETSNTDQIGRFKYQGSIQEKLGVIGKPVVNYYFEIIIDALNAILPNEKQLKKRKLFEEWSLMLTHDIDYIDHYTFERFLYKIKEVFGLVKTYYSLKSNIKHLIHYIIQFLKFSFKDNPSWSFEYMRKVEKRNNFFSVFYFLHKDYKKLDSRYRFSDRRIRNLFDYLKAEKCEIGLHGTVKSVDDFKEAKKFYDELKLNAGIKKMGLRQHRLLYKFPQTTKIHERLNLNYDTTLSFAEHEGFRNSFCLPFKLYDFDSDRMFDIWEIPLNIMDVTIFHYRNMSNPEAMKTIQNLINEVKKFNGVLTVLWHNDFFNEDRFPGITEFYEDLHSHLAKEKANCLLGLDIVSKLNETEFIQT